MEPISPVCSDMETGSVSNRRDGEEVESQISQDSSYVQVRKKVRALSPNQVERNGFTSGNGRHLNVPGFALGEILTQSLDANNKEIHYQGSSKLFIAKQKVGYTKAIYVYSCVL